LLGFDWIVLECVCLPGQFMHTLLWPVNEKLSLCSYVKHSDWCYMKALFLKVYMTMT
jgi:hypothetical protein